MILVCPILCLETLNLTCCFTLGYSCDVTSGFEPINTVLEGCYLMSQEEVTWQKGSEGCQQRGGHLIAPKIDNQMALVVDRLKSTSKKAIWIGLQKHQLKDWTWNDGSPIGMELAALLATMRVKFRQLHC